MIVCRTLGPVEITVDSAPAPTELRWRKHLALLLYLACSPKRTRARDHLIGLLWSDKPESAARHSLNEAVRVLRRHCAEGEIRTGGNQIHLGPNVVQLDIERFDGLTAAGDWLGAAELIAGEFLEGFSVPGAPDFENWLTTERSTWRHRAVDALVRCADSLADEGKAEASTSYAQRALGLDPRSERAIRASMRSLAVAGDRAGALEQYDAFRARLADEIGVEPGVETRALADRIRQQRAWPPLTSRPPTQRGQSRRAPLVGRESELGRLLTVWAECRSDRKAVVSIIAGEAGTGKTRLVDELLARARLDGAAVGAVRAVEADRAAAWSGVLALARSGLLAAPGLAAAPSAALAAFTAVLPEWEERFGGAVRGLTPSPMGRAFSEVLRVISEERPVLLALDDAQWLDRESLLTLIAAVRDLARAPLAIVFAGTANLPPEIDEIRVRIGGDLAGVSLRLAPLQGEALFALARWALPQFNASQLDRICRRVATDSAGLPLLVVEIFHAVALGLELESSARAWPEPFKTLDQTMPGDLPDNVVSAIRIGYRRLSPNAQLVLSAAAILGDRVTPSVLGRACALGPEDLTAALDELEWQRWLIAEPRGYAFVARITRDVIGRDTLTAGQRRRILERAGLLETA